MFPRSFFFFFWGLSIKHGPLNSILENKRIDVNFKWEKGFKKRFKNKERTRKKLGRKIRKTKKN